MTAGCRWPSRTGALRVFIEHLPGSIDDATYLPHHGGGHYIHAEKLRHSNTQTATTLARPTATTP